MRDNFETYWPRLSEKLEHVGKIPLSQEKTKDHAVVEPPRDNRDILGEILELVRNQQRRVSAIEGRIVGPSPSSSAKPASTNEFYKEITVRFPAEPTNVQDIVDALTKGFQRSIPGTMIGLKDAEKNIVQVTINFPYPIDEDFVDDLLENVIEQSGLEYSGYSSKPAW